MTASPEHEIVVGVDGSPGSAAALRWAVRQARLTGATLRAVTAWDVEPTLSLGWPPMPRNPGAERRAQRAVLAAVESELGEDPDLSYVVTAAEGTASRVLQDRSRHAALLVVGDRGHRHAGEAVLGSVIQRCVSGAGCPVVVVRGAVGDGGIVVGVDGSEPSLEALDWAAEQAARTGSTLRVVHAGDEAGSSGGGPQAQRRRTLQAAVARVAKQRDGASVVVDARQGPASEVLAAASDGAELLVVGSRGRGLVSGTLLGSVSRDCVRHARCPIVVHHRSASASRRADVA
jgi:nucleotide-binding universal stress UspA family protein